MRQMPAGQWVAFDGYDTVHVCHSIEPRGKPTDEKEKSAKTNTNSNDFLSDIEIPNISITKKYKQVNSAGEKISPDRQSNKQTNKIQNKSQTVYQKEKEVFQNREYSFQKEIRNAFSQTYNDLSPIIIIFGPIILLLLLLLCQLSTSSQKDTSNTTTSKSQPTLVYNREVISKPTVKPTSTNTYINVCVVVDSLRIRGGPGIEYGLVGGLIYGDCVLVDKKSKDNLWYHVINISADGWIYAEYVTIK